MRLDKYLKVSRLAKRRAEAKDGIEAGRITKDGRALKPGYEVKVGDPASHSLGLAQVKCHATKPAEIGGDKSKEAVSTYAYDQSGDKSREHGIYMLSLESGDKVSLPYLGTITLKDGKGIGARGTWSFGEGTGKLKGIKGKGTWHCSPTPDGGFNCSGEGEYELAK